jgi:hypothetical protein
VEEVTIGLREGQSAQGSLKKFEYHARRCSPLTLNIHKTCKCGQKIDGSHTLAFQRPTLA